MVLFFISLHLWAENKNRIKAPEARLGISNWSQASH